MDSPRQTVNALIARAKDAASSEEEARTSAMAAVRLIVKYDMLGRRGSDFLACEVERLTRELAAATAECERLRRRTSAEPSTVSVHRFRTKEPTEAMSFGICATCNNWYNRYDRVDVRNNVTYHADCTPANLR